MIRLRRITELQVGHVIIPKSRWGRDIVVGKRYPLTRVTIPDSQGFVGVYSGKFLGYFNIRSLHNWCIVTHEFNKYYEAV